MSMRIFLISGKKGSGKDTVADCIKKVMGDVGAFHFIEKKPLAAFIKEELPNVFGFDPSLCHTREGKESRPPELAGKTVREALQIFGTNGLRAINPDIHCIKTMEDIFASYRSFKYDEFGNDVDTGAIIPDCRFLNEVRYFLEMVKYEEVEVRACLIKLTRDPYKDGDSHASEDISWHDNVPDGEDVITIDNENLDLDETLRLAGDFALRFVKDLPW